MKRYVILEHDHPVLHWDLMLEASGALRTWRLAALPEPGRAVPAEPSFDHRMVYLDYEGPVSGDRGRVRRWDWGMYTTEEDADGLVLRLEGTRLRGAAHLRRDGSGQWNLTVAAATGLTDSPEVPSPEEPG